MTPTSEERREVAERLRVTKAECDERGYPWMVEDLLQTLGFETYEDGDDFIFDLLADLIDPTCRDMGGSVPGVSAFECSRCGALLNVCDGGGLRVAGHYYDDTPNVSISYCPNCGARVVRDNDRDSK